MWTAFLDELEEAAREEFSSHHKGVQWQSEFGSMAESRGLTVAAVRQHEGRHDLWVAGMRVQCKHIDESRSGVVSIDNMRPVKANNNERGYRVGEYEVMALRHSGNVFIIPASELVDNERPGFLMSKVQIVRFRDYIDAWTVFSGGEVNRTFLF